MYKMMYKNVLCLVVGLMVGIRLTDFWQYWNIQQVAEICLSDSQKESEIGSEDHLESRNHNRPHNLAEDLFNQTRVLCWIMTSPRNHMKRAIHIRNTWGRRCNTLIFMSSTKDQFLPTIKLPVREGRDHLWEKTLEAFKYLYDHFLYKADWFLKADDDTYFIMENLRYFLHPFNPDEPVYFGCRFRPYVEQGYMSGGAGYVLSREALRRFGKLGYPSRDICQRSQQAEDVEMGHCLQEVGVIAGDSRDEDLKERFLPLPPQHLIPVDVTEWYSEHLFYKHDRSNACCSRNAISFHYIKPKDFYMLDYFIYEFQAFGVNQGDGRRQQLPKKANMTELMRRWRDEESDNY